MSKQKLDELINMVTNVEKGLNALNTGDDFCNKANLSLSAALQKVEDLKKKEEENKKIYHETIKYFGYKEKDKYYEENGLFFKMLINFFKEINKQMPKLDVKKVLDQNRVMGKKVDQKSLMNNLMSQLKQKVEKKD